MVNAHDHRTGTGDDAKLILDFAKANKSRSIEALIKPVPPASNKTDNFNYGVAVVRQRVRRVLFPAAREHLQDAD